MNSQTESRPSVDELHYIDTSVLRYLFCSTSRAREYYAQVLGPRRFVCEYVRMEFVRSFVSTLIQYHSVVAMPHIKSIHDANALWSNRFSARQLSVVLMFAQSLFGAHRIDFGNPNHKPKALRLLGDYIRRLVSKVNRLYKDTGVDSTHCARPTSIEDFDPLNIESSLASFHASFNDTETAKSKCSVETFVFKDRKDDVGKMIEATPIPSSDRRGFEEIVKKLRAVGTDPQKMTCRKCAGIGDAIIALLSPANMRLEHTDYSFDHLMPVLRKAHFRHGSEIELNR